MKTATSTGRTRGRRTWAWTLARGILFASGVSLFAYIAYRYSVGSAPDHGSLYGVLFSSSSLLAAGALLFAVRPHLMNRIPGFTGPVVRGGVVLLGVGWMATGLLCLGALARGVVSSPLFGTLDLIHMLSHHVVIPVALGFLALDSRKAERWLSGGPPHKSRPAEEPASAAGPAGTAASGASADSPGG